MNKAENFKSIDEFNATFPKMHFSHWYELGPVVEPGPEIRRLKNNTLPLAKHGLYIVGIKLPGSKDIVMIYFGVATLNGGVRNRLENHFRYSQNDRAGKKSGLLVGAKALNMVGTYYASYYVPTVETPGATLAERQQLFKKHCESLETDVLSKWDFICNTEKKMVATRRIPDLVKLLVVAEDDAASVVEEAPAVEEAPVVEEATAVEEAPVVESAVVVESATAVTAVTAVKKEDQERSLIIAICGCGKAYKASHVRLNIKCNCGTLFEFL